MDQKGDWVHFPFRPDREFLSLSRVHLFKLDVSKFKFLFFFRFEIEETEKAEHDIDANIWRQVHKLGSKMHGKEIPVNDQFQILRNVNKMDFSFNSSQIKEMLLRDSSRKSDIFLTKCVVSKTKRDPFILAMNNIGGVKLVYNTSEKIVVRPNTKLNHKSIDMNQIKMDLNKSSNSKFKFEEDQELLLPQFEREFFVCMETISIDAETSLIFLADNKENLNLFSKKSIDFEDEDDYASSIQ